MLINSVIRRIVEEKWLDSSISEDALDNERVALAVAQNCPEEFIKLSARLRGNKELLILVLKNIRKSIDPESPQPIELASDSLQDDDDIAALSIQKNPCSIQWLSGRLQDNEDLTQIAMNATPLSYPGLSPRLRDRDDYIKSYALAVENCGCYCLCAEDYLPEELSKCVKENGFSTHVIQAWLLKRKLDSELSVKLGRPIKRYKLKI